MPYRKLTLLTASVAILLMMMTSAASASAFSAVVVYGDSLSDNGNAYALSGGTIPPSPPYDQRFSNGPVGVEQLASFLGVPIADFAFGGATTGIGNYFDGGSQTSVGHLGLPGMQEELASPPSTALLSSPIVPSALFVVWGGANDFLVGGSIATAVGNIDSIVSTLETAGAKHILVPGIPDMGLTPDFLGDPLATLYSESFNTLLQATLPFGATYVDTFNLLHQIDADPAAYGFTNVTQPCLAADLSSQCTDPNEYLFWDGFHPTTAADAILAKTFADAVPEPSSFILLGSGLSSLAVLVRQRRRRSTLME
jgi:cholinesterase